MNPYVLSVVAVSVAGVLAYVLWRIFRSPYKSGIGASFSRFGNGHIRSWIVSELFPGGALNRAGIKLGATVLEIDGTSIIGISEARFRELIRKPLGARTSMTFRTANDEVCTVSLVYELEQRFGAKGVLFKTNRVSGAGYLDSTRVTHGITVSLTRKEKYASGRLTDEAIDSSL